jgi:hypothetical protein
MLIALLGVLALGALIFTARLLQAILARATWPRVEAIALGAITNFFDTLGIGSFAPTMAWLKLRNLVPLHNAGWPHVAGLGAGGDLPGAAGCLG